MKTFKEIGDNFAIRKNNNNCYDVYLTITGDYMFITDAEEKVESIVKALDETYLNKHKGDE